MAENIAIQKPSDGFFSNLTKVKTRIQTISTLEDFNRLLLDLSKFRENTQFVDFSGEVSKT